jgi:hypothetical protein
VVNVGGDEATFAGPTTTAKPHLFRAWNSGADVPSAGAQLRCENATGEPPYVEARRCQRPSTCYLPGTLSRRRNVLIHLEEVGRVVSVLDLA